MSEPIATMHVGRPADVAQLHPDGDGEYRLLRLRRGDGRPLDEAWIEAETREQAVVEAILYLGLNRGERVRVLFGTWTGREIDAGYLLDQWTHPDERERNPG